MAAYPARVVLSCVFPSRRIAGPGLAVEFGDLCFFEVLDWPVPETDTMSMVSMC